MDPFWTRTQYLDLGPIFPDVSDSGPAFDLGHYYI